MMADEYTVHLHRELQGLAGERGWVNGARLVQRLAERMHIPHLEVRQALLALAQNTMIGNIGPTGDPLGRVTVLQRVPEQPRPMAEHERTWRELVASQGLESA